MASGGSQPEQHPDQQPAAPAAGPSFPSLPSVKDLQSAQESATLCESFLRLTREQHMTTTGAARHLGRPASLFSGQNSMLARYLRGGLAALAPTPRETSARPESLTAQIENLGWFIPAARFFWLTCNSTHDRGSVPESIRRTISLPNLPIGWKKSDRARFLRAIGAGTGAGTSRPRSDSNPSIHQSTNPSIPSCPPDLREAILARERDGKPLVPERVARQITRPRAVVRQYRHATNASLDFLNAAGSLFFFNDPLTGERRPPLPGEVIEADDATINFPVCVPWTLGGDKCSDRYGVKVGRFQWLVAVDAASRFVTAWSYIMRPRSSYRAEDALSLMRAHCVQHGIPLQWRFEQGVWKSNLVQAAIKAMGSNLHTVWSPHQKPFIEGLFNTLWTKLSVQFPWSQLGRFRDENEDANDLLVACQRGHQDPRKHFPMLQATIASFTESIAEKQRTPVNSDVGRWIPEEKWLGRPERTSDFGLRTSDFDWMFSPAARDWTVRGMLVGGRIPLFEDLSVPFDFTAPWLCDYDGCRVRVHFDPAAPRCTGTIVLLQNFRDRKAGDVLGTAQQINEVAGYARLVLGWGDDPQNAGRLARQRAASALRREVRSVVGGRAGSPSTPFSLSEERDGVATITRLESAPSDGRARSPSAPSEEPRAEADGRAQAHDQDDESILSARERRAEAFMQEHALDFIT